MRNSKVFEIRASATNIINRFCVALMTYTRCKLLAGCNSCASICTHDADKQPTYANCGTE